MTEKQRATLLCLLLALVTLAVYWPATHFDFINYDDPDYVLLNLPIQHGVTRDTVAWAFTTSHASNWHPLTWLSHAADCALFGLDPGAHHRTNLLFHTANSVLLFLVLWQLTRAQWRSALVAALFAWHPLHVESVAWVSERKDVLSAFFFILTLWAYGRYVRNSETMPPNSGDESQTRLASSDFTPQSAIRNPQSAIPNPQYAQAWYLLALFLFVLALLSKPMVITLPFILLLLDVWPLNRISNLKFQISNSTENGSAPQMPGLSIPHSALRILRSKIFIEKIPFFVLAFLDCLATFWAQKESNSVVSFAVLPFPDRLANALVSYVLYLWKTVWPVNLALPYPYSQEWSLVPAAAAALSLVLVSVVALQCLRRQPFLAVGWFWFLITLVPAIGLVQVGLQPMADRYTYLPLIGVFIAVVWAIPAAWTEWPRPGFVFSAVVAGVLLFLLTGAEVQLKYWRNSVTLFSHTVAVTSNNILAQYNLAEATARLGRPDLAIPAYQAVLAMHPNRVEAEYNSQVQARYNLGLIYRSLKMWPEAEAQFRDFIHDDPAEPGGYIELGIVLAAQDHPDEAAQQFHQAIRLRPFEHGESENIEILAKIEAAYFEAGKIPEAIAAAQKTRDAALLEGRMDVAAATEKRLATYRAALH